LFVGGLCGEWISTGFVSMPYSKLRQNRLKHPAKIPVNVIIDEANDAIALFAKECRSPRVVAQFLVGGMSRAINLHDQFGLAARKIDKLRPYRLLANKLEPAKRATAQRLP
jgi:hypothetical protein